MSHGLVLNPDIIVLYNERHSSTQGHGTEPWNYIADQHTPCWITHLHGMGPWKDQNE